MAGVDPAATRAAARTLEGVAQDVAGARGGADCASVSGVLSDASARHVLDDVQTAVQLRLLEFGGELSALATGMTTLADNVDAAMGSGR